MIVTQSFPINSYVFLIIFYSISSLHYLKIFYFNFNSNFKFSPVLDYNYLRIFISTPLTLTVYLEKFVIVE